MPAVLRESLAQKIGANDFRNRFGLNPSGCDNCPLTAKDCFAVDLEQIPKTIRQAIMITPVTSFFSDGGTCLFPRKDRRNGVGRDTIRCFQLQNDKPRTEATPDVDILEELARTGYPA